MATRLHLHIRKRGHDHGQQDTVCKPSGGVDTDGVNSENAPAYALAPKQALAQYAATGCFGRTFYATADEQLTRVLELCDAIDPEFVARMAIYSRTRSFMKDMPALLCAWLSARDRRLHEAVF